MRGFTFAKVHVVLLSGLAAAWWSLTSTGPIASIAPDDARVRELATLEDAYALERGNADLVNALAATYLELGHPHMAIAVLSATDPEVRRDPAVLHRLAQAYEQAGRIDDALSTAQLARARCARALGTRDSARSTPVPTHRCSHGTLAALDVHRTALEHMTQWGVSDVQTDPRAARAYSVAIRRGRILSASAR